MEDVNIDRRIYKRRHTHTDKEYDTSCEKPRVTSMPFDPACCHEPLVVLSM